MEMNYGPGVRGPIKCMVTYYALQPDTMAPMCGCQIALWYAVAKKFLYLAWVCLRCFCIGTESVGGFGFSAVVRGYTRCHTQVIGAMKLLL